MRWLFLAGIYDDDPEIITLSKSDFGESFYMLFSMDLNG